jgi:two-component system, cell cycle sensor histidine kinase and response regulator CckA
MSAPNPLPNFSFSNLTIVKRLVIIAFLANLLFMALAGVTLQQQRIQYESAAEIVTRNICEVLNQNISGIIKEADLGLLSVKEEYEQQQAGKGVNPEKLNAFISRQKGRLPQIDNLRIADSNSFVKYGTEVHAGKIVSILDRDYFKQLRDDPRVDFVISKPLLGYQSHKWVIILARRINHADGSFGGVVYCPITLETFSKMFAAIDLGKGGVITLRDEQMGLIVRHPQLGPPGRASGLRLVSKELEKLLAQGQTAGTYITPAAGSDNIARLISFKKIGHHPLYIIVGKSQKEYLAEWRSDVIKVSLLVLLIIISSAAAVWVVHKTRRNEQSAVDRLVQQEEKYRNIFENAPIGIFQSLPGGQFITVNTRHAQLFGYETSEEMIAATRDISSQVYAYPTQRAEILQRLDITDQVTFEDIEFLHKDGSHFYVNLYMRAIRGANGELQMLEGFLADITERRVAEQKLLHEREFSSEALNSLPGVFYVIGQENGFLRWNNNFETVSEYTSEEFSRMSPLDLFIGTDKNLISDWMREVFVKGAASVEAELATKSGQRIAYHFTGRTIQIEGAACLIGMGIEITDRKRAEEERLKMEQQLLHAQKLESLGVLAGGIAHDFNNILMAIIGNADLALMRLSKESPATDNLHRIESAAAKAADLAKQMLAYSGKGKFVIEHLDLNRLLEEMLHMLEVSISKKAVLRLNLTENLPPVEADATQMRQILMNLVINASEAIGDKSGVIAISTGCMDCDRNYLNDVWLDENIAAGLYVYLEIADTGCGMDKETMVKIFDPFFTTKFTGRGLGMAAVLGIVRGHNGAIKVYSEPGKGTTFKVLLPASGKPVEIFNHDSRTDDWRGSGIVLLVDDEETVRGIGKEMLHELGFTAITANDGREAIELFKQTPDVSFVILDLTMPHMDGDQCFRELRQLKPDIKVIMSSGFSEYEVTQKFAGKGLAGFIQKPYKMSVLKEAIQKM